MLSLALHAAHAAAVVAGVVLIARLARSKAVDGVVWGATLGASMALGLVLFKVSDPTLRFADFYDAYRAAGEAVLSGPEALRPTFERGVYGYVNMPIVAYLFAPFALMGRVTSGLAFLALGGLATLGAWRSVTQRYGFTRVEAATSLFALAAFGPLVYSVKEGNTSHILMAILVWGAALVAERKDLRAGAIFGVAAVIKPPLLLLGVFYFLKGRFAIALGGFIVCAACLGLSVFVFSWDMHAVWIEQYRAYGGAPLAVFNSQSIMSAVARFELGPEFYRTWELQEVAWWVRGIAWMLTLGVAAAGIWAALGAPGRIARSAEADEIELLYLISFVCLASTVSWSHYFVWLLPAFAFIFTRTRGGESAVARRWLLAAFILAAPVVFLSEAMNDGAYGPFSGLLSSHLLFGGIIICGLLAWLRAGRPGMPPHARERDVAATVGAVGPSAERAAINAPSRSSPPK